MKRVEVNGISCWQFENLSAEPSIRHFVTDRRSANAGNDFTLSFSSSENKEMIRSNRNALAKAMGVEISGLIFPSQVHSNRIVHVTSGTSKNELMETDSLMTSEPGICIAVMSADCVPILILDKKNFAVAAVHSGWRGTVAKILEKTLLQMNRQFGTEGHSIVAGIGPSVSRDSYEVGEEVIREVFDAFGKRADLLSDHKDGKARLDLWAANKIQLIDFGVKESAIEIADLCTVKNNDHFFSARKGDKGRFAAGIMIR